MTTPEPHMVLAVCILRLGAFFGGLAGYLVASHYQFAYAGWILLPTILAGLMCCSLGFWEDEDKPKKQVKSGERIAQ